LEKIKKIHAFIFKKTLMIKSELSHKQLIELLEIAESENKLLAQETAEVVSLIRKICGILGFMDTKTNSIKPELLSGETNVFGLLLESLSGIIGLITKSKMPVIGKKYEKQLDEQFSFVKDIVPLVEKYATAK